MSIVYRGTVFSRVSFVSRAAGWSCWSSLSLSSRGSVVSTKTKRTLFPGRSKGSGFSDWTLAGTEVDVRCRRRASRSQHFTQTGSYNRGMSSLRNSCCSQWRHFVSLCSTVFSYKLRAVLTVGPGGPTLPADPGKPVGPWKQKMTQGAQVYKLYNRIQCICCK